MCHHQLSIGPLDWKQWQDSCLRRQTASEFVDYPVPQHTITPSQHEWEQHIADKTQLIFGIFWEQEIVGILKAFDFSQSYKSCEIGIEILRVQDYGKSWGRWGLELWLEALKSKGITQVKGLIHPHNQRSLRLFARAGFQTSALVTDPEEPTWVFVKVERAL